MGVFGGALGRVISGAGGPARAGGGAGGAGARVRVGFGGLRGACARCAHSGDDVALQMRLSQRERGGCFRDGVWCGGSSRWRRDALLAGAAVGRSGGLPQGFLCGFVVQAPGRSRSATRPVRGEGEACVSARGAWGSPRGLAALWHFGNWQLALRA